MLGAEVTLAVANADLAFATRGEAQWTAAHLADDHVVHLAVGITAERHDIDIAAARSLLADSAERAGITDVQAAMALIHGQRAVTHGLSRAQGLMCACFSGFWVPAPQAETPARAGDSARSTGSSQRPGEPRLRGLRQSLRLPSGGMLVA